MSSAMSTMAYLLVRFAIRTGVSTQVLAVRQLSIPMGVFLGRLVRGGQTVIGLGASTKGNALLQFFGIDKHLMPYISERNPDKVGLRTLGTDIELISEERARELDPACMLVLIWFFKQELLRREQSYLDRGGALLFPMPYCHLVTEDGEQPI